MHVITDRCLRDNDEAFCASLSVGAERSARRNKDFAAVYDFLELVIN